MNPLLDAMREKGGQARPREIYDTIAQNLNLSDEERTVTNKNGYPRSENQIAWARSYFVRPATSTFPLVASGDLPIRAKRPTLTGLIST